MFSRQAAATPQALALIERDDTLTYAELHEEVLRVAGGLLAQGTAPGDSIAVLCPRSRESVISMLAVMHVGAIYVPIDPEVPVGRIRHILDSAVPRLVVCASDASRSVPQGYRALSFDTLRAARQRWRRRWRGIPAIPHISFSHPAPRGCPRAWS